MPLADNTPIQWQLDDNAASQHLLHFYKTDQALLSPLVDFFKTGLEAGHACIVIATKSHRQALEDGLTGQGVDVPTARRSGHYIALDAAETLSHFTVDGIPDPSRFNEVIGGLIAQTAATHSRIRAFGEMVVLLWEQGNRPGAIRLEQLWNAAGKTRNFSLMCAYPLHLEQFQEIHREHTRVV